MDYIWILFAFLCGFGMKLLQLPPLIGFLLAGFLLNALGFSAQPALHDLADLGITLMLFTIGLKLNIRDLLKREVWAAGGGHMAAWVALIGCVSAGLIGLGLWSADAATAPVLFLFAFALSFSSTVCAVKLLEESGEMKTRHGKLAVAILVFQDIVAVFFLVAATGKLPSWWALALPLLFFLRPLLARLLDAAGHGELLPLTGFFLALGAYELFELVNVKGDLGALIAGMLLSSHLKAAELNKALLSFKDLFLVGFFLTIGMAALPSWSMLGVALLLLLLIPLKFLMFFGFFSVVGLRGRTAYLSSLALANFSEFGLIVLALSRDAGWVSESWLVTLALAVSLSFVFTSVVYRRAHTIYRKYQALISRWQRPEPLPEDVIHQPASVEILVVGLGRVGKGAYAALQQMVPDQVWGMDSDSRNVRQYRSQGYAVFMGDGEDADLWDKLNLGSIRLVLLALPSIEDMLNVTEQLREAGYSGQLAAIARYEDQQAKLKAGGIDCVFNFFTEAGTGFAEESLRLIGHTNPVRRDRASA